MAMLSFAFSIHNFINSVGADAGFAAIIGLAVLVLLYFAHARETANLREEAALLTQRLQHAEARVAQLTQMQPASGAAPDSAAQLPAEAVALGRFAPAGTAAPALASATHVLPLALPEPDLAEAVPEAEEQAATVPVAAMAMTGAALSPAGVAARVVPSTAAASSPAPVAASPTGASASLPAPATNAGGNGSGHQPVPPVPRASPPPSRPLPPLELPPRPRRWRLGRGVAVAVAALAAVAIAVVLFAVTAVGGSSDKTPASPASNAPGAAHARTASAFKPSSVTVAVLNGTAINELAHRIAARLAAVGYKHGMIATAANQTETATAVAYLAGSKNRADALHVASALGLRRTAVEPVDQSTLQVACPAPSACTANVIVTVGSDLATH